MRGMSLLFTGVAAGLSACVAAPATPRGPQPTYGPSQTVEYRGVAFQSKLLAGQPGRALTPAGAMPVNGLRVVVAPFADDQGRMAKDVARIACDRAGGRFNTSALGTYVNGAWVFEGGCA